MIRVGDVGCVRIIRCENLVIADVDLARVLNNNDFHVALNHVKGKATGYVGQDRGSRAPFRHFIGDEADDLLVLFAAPILDPQGVAKSKMHLG